MAKDDKEPDFEDIQAVVDWINDDKVDATERHNRANEAYGRESRRPQPRGAIMNAASDVRSLSGPPSANQ